MTEPLILGDEEDPISLRVLPGAEGGSEMLMIEPESSGLSVPALESLPWDESTRPRGPEVDPPYSVAEVRAGAQSAGEARASLNEMAMGQNDWVLGAFCNQYCQVVTQHHGHWRTPPARAMI